MIENLSIEESSQKPKYLQLADSILLQIEEGRMLVNQRLPSVNNLSKDLHISRETVFKALKHLSEMGVVRSSNRRGYFIQKVSARPPLRIFLMLDKMTTFKDELYHSFHEAIGTKGEIDVFFHHHNPKVFENLITDNLHNYTHFVIVTFMREDVSDTLNLIPPEKRIILDYPERNLQGDYTIIYQDFSRNVQSALEEAQEQLAKYQQLILIAPDNTSHFGDLHKGFHHFIEDSGFPSQIHTTIEEGTFKKGNAYFTTRAVDDRDMIKVIKLCRKHGFVLGRDIGLITYNDSEVKEILEGGITAVAGDFVQMGKLVAEKILKKESGVVAVPSKLILRNSL